MTSDITRARQTGEPVAAHYGVPLITHRGVREIFAGDWEMDPEWTPYQDVIASWAKDPTVSMPQGENGVSFFSRFDSAIEELHSYDCAVVVSHGAALYTWLSGRGDQKIGGDPSWRLYNTAMVKVEGEPGSWRILSWADRNLTTEHHGF